MGKCEKVTFLSFKLAQKSAETLYEKRRWVLKPYRCKECKKFHLYTSFKDKGYYEKKEVNIENDSMARYEIDIIEIGNEIKEKEDQRNYFLRKFGLK